MKKFYQKGRRKPIKAGNAIDGASSRNKDWGFSPVPCKGGKTLNWGAPDNEKKEGK